MQIKCVESAETTVKKFVFSTESWVAESVLYRYPTYQERTVICCSTMSGCPVGCRFCGAGDAFVKALSAKDIVDQVDYCLSQTDVHAGEIERLQIMFMSMGEPMLNMGNLVEAIRELHSKYPQAELLVSTIGPRVDYAPFIEVSKEIDKVGLQFSIHETEARRRDALIPFKKKLTLKEISELGNYWYLATGRTPFFNYCATEANSRPEDAQALAELFPPEIWQATVSVVCERNEGMPSRNEKQQSLASTFSTELLKKGFNVRVFDPAGQDDIGGGCGQLWYVQDWMKNNPDKARPSVGASLPSLHAPR